MAKSGKGYRFCVRGMRLSRERQRQCAKSAKRANDIGCGASAWRV
jgi:hypothetical protein